MRTFATSEKAINALKMLSQSQDYFARQLSQLCKKEQLPAKFNALQWLRDNGIHGGGERLEAPQNSLFNRGSINISQIHYEDKLDKKFISATALSTIIHPQNPIIPSIHIHVSWTELRSGKSYWRLMADLNPAIVSEQDQILFNDMLKQVGGEYINEATQQGDDYFYIPALKKHRGISHFYLEAFNPNNEDGQQFAFQFVTAVMDCYITIFSDNLNNKITPTAIQKQTQLDYHTLYFYQVLTLDKGTTAGLLLHDQNDIGTLGSLPRFINRELLALWVDKTPAPRNVLINAFLTVLPDTKQCEISAPIKASIAHVMRQHYQSNNIC